MPKFKIGAHFGFVGTDYEEVIEAEDLEEAMDIARDHVMNQVEWWAEPLEGGEKSKP